MTSNCADPFGLLFLCSAVATAIEVPPSTYDELEGISYVFDGEGRRVPLVELCLPQATLTATSVEGETSDADESPLAPMMATQTVTEAGGEDGDIDAQQPERTVTAPMATETTTRAGGEGKDADLYAYPFDLGVAFPVCSTSTATKADGEQGDPD